MVSPEQNIHHVVPAKVGGQQITLDKYFERQQITLGKYFKPNIWRGQIASTELAILFLLLTELIRETYQSNVLLGIPCVGIPLDRVTFNFPLLCQLNRNTKYENLIWFPLPLPGFHIEYFCSVDHQKKIDWYEITRYEMLRNKIKPYEKGRNQVCWTHGASHKSRHSIPDNRDMIRYDKIW